MTGSKNRAPGGAGVDLAADAGAERLDPAVVLVRMTTSLGQIELQLDLRAAPATSRNFLRYVDEALFSGGSFYRAMRREHWTPGRELELVQGGLHGSGNASLEPIVHESPAATGLRHVRGAISMARGPVGSASSEFFICVEDCPGLDPTTDPIPPADGLGYAVFGHVTAGMDVIREIHRQPTSDESDLELLRGQLLRQPVMLVKVDRVCSVNLRPDDTSIQLADFAERYWQHYLHESPVTGIDHGHLDATSVFMREGLADYARRRETRNRLIHELGGIDASKLNKKDSVTHALLERQLNLDSRLDLLDEHLRPTLFPFGPDMVPPFAAGKTTLSTAAQAEQYVQRLSSIAVTFTDILERLREGTTRGHKLPHSLLAPIRANIKAQIAQPPAQSVWMAPFEGLPAFVADGEALRASALSVLENSVYPAYAAFAHEIAQLYELASRESIACRETPGGEAYYRCLIERHTSLALSPEEIHQIGQDELASLSVRMTEVARAAGFGGDVQALRVHLQSHSRFVLGSAAQVKQHIEVLSKRIDRLIPQYFGTVPRATYGVESIPPELSAQMPPAYAQPAPANRTASGIHWVSSLPERCPTYMHVPLALHEAWPGHLMHIALLEEMSDLPNFRRYGFDNYTAYIEGWALYCEGLGEEMGLYSDSFDLAGRLMMDSWRAARLVIDTGIHWMGWPRQRAIDFLLGHSTLTPGAAAAEVDRYIGMPGQALAYKLGERSIRHLRSKAEQMLGGSFELRHFHDVLVAAGPVTLPVLEAFVQEWLLSKSVQTG